jgi:hypothetical protein
MPLLHICLFKRRGRRYDNHSLERGPLCPLATTGIGGFGGLLKCLNRCGLSILTVTADVTDAAARARSIVVGAKGKGQLSG